MRLAVLLAAGLALTVACSDGDRSASTTQWHAVPADALGPGLTRIVDSATLPDGVIGVGSVTTGGERVPAAWISKDGTSWTRLETEPKSPYGFESELTTVAAGLDGRAAAMGQAVGGTHGNPRIGSWYLDGTTLREVVAPVELYGGPRQGSVDEMAAGPAGFVVVGTRTDRNDRTGAAVWTSPDAHAEFEILDTDPALESAPDELVRAIGAAGSPAGYLAVGDRIEKGRIDDDAVFWTSTTGRRWSRIGLPDATVGGPGDELPMVATAWGDGWAAAGTETVAGRTGVAVWTTPDGTHWRRTRLENLGTDPDPLSAVTSLTASGGELVVGARLGTRFVAARSTDGQRWEQIELPADAVADQHGRIVVEPTPDHLVLAATTDHGTRLWTETRNA